jgi:hypothetical protein
VDVLNVKRKIYSRKTDFLGTYPFVFVYAPQYWSALGNVAEPHHFYAAPAPGENFDAAPVASALVALSTAPNLPVLYSKAKFLKRTKVSIHVETILFMWFRTIYFAENMNWMG